jgi:DNA-binding winged helix-turn-helix (wHTH) protein
MHQEDEVVFNHNAKCYETFPTLSRRGFEARMSESPLTRQTAKTKKRKQAKKGAQEGGKKTLAAQRVPSSREPELLSTPLLDHPLAQIRSTDLTKTHQLSEFIPVIVLIPKSTVTGQAILSKISLQPPKGNSKTSKLPRQLSNTAQQYKRTSPEGEFVFGDAAVNFSAMEVRRKGQSVALTALEFKILKYMIQNERRALSRDELLNRVWGYENYPHTRTVDNFILRLRQKFEPDPSRPTHFRTVHGIGYKFFSHGDL